MTFLSYAQNYEDVLLWRALQDVLKGNYVDIGAQDPVIDSVSKAFHLRGWKGVHVDPSPTYVQALREDRPDDVVIQAAVGMDAGPIPFFLIQDTGLSTGIPSIAEEHRANGYAIEELSVSVVSLAEILERLARDPVHWMKIDVEGMEADVLDSWGKCAVRPWILVIEATHPNSQRRVESQWIEKVHGRDYHEVYFDGLNHYFVSDAHRELDSAFDAPPNVFDQFAVASHHFSANVICHENHQRITGLEAALNDAIADRDAAVSEAQLHKDACDRLSHDYDRVAQSAVVLAAQIEDRDRRLAELVESEAAARKSLADATALQAEHVARHAQQVNELRVELERATTALQERMSAWKAKSAEARAKLSSAADEIQALATRLRAADDTIASLISQNEAAHLNHATALEQLAAAHRQQLAAEHSERAAIVRQLEHARQQIIELEAARLEIIRSIRQHRAAGMSGLARRFGMKLGLHDPALWEMRVGLNTDRAVTRDIGQDGSVER